MRLVRSSTDLAQRKGEAYRKDITWEEIRKHNQPHDGWMVLRGVVYNIGPYLPYHPGGVEIFSKAKLLGADGTKAFDKYHPWVSIEGLIETLAIGSVAFIPDIEDVRESDEDDEDEDDTVGNTIATKA
jgi:cytochrome-b5 reductase